MLDIKSANVTVMISDMDASIKFYTEVLGFQLVNRFGDHWADVQGPGISIGLHPTSADQARANNLQIGLRVDNLEQSVSTLKNLGVPVAANSDDQVRLATFSDPDENILYLVQPQF
ncbi:MAG: VOC family protein [Saprospiraceae bacterium]|nr:VOC family protein [Saprospiraceae bacterium]